MAKLGLKVEAGFEPPKSDFDLITPGWYEAEVIDSEVRNSASSGNDYLNLTYMIVGAGEGGDPQFIERRVWQVLSIYHPTEKTRNRSLADLKSIAAASGLDGYDDTDDVVGSRLQVEIGTQVSKDPRYDDKSVVKGYQTSNHVAAAPPSAPKTPWAA
jgi:hypothetical protein